MVPKALEDRLRNFIVEYVDSVELLEVLLLLRRRPDRSWTCQEISDELRTNPTSVANRVRTLKAKNLVATQGSPGPHLTARYAPVDPDLALLVDHLASYYRERRVTVIDLIFSRPRQKIQIFADAFRFRKD